MSTDPNDPKWAEPARHWELSFYTPASVDSDDILEALATLINALYDCDVGLRETTNDQ